MNDTDYEGNCKAAELVSDEELAELAAAKEAAEVDRMAGIVYRGLLNPELAEDAKPVQEEKPVAIEARCTKCGSTFNPNDFDDLEHLERPNGEPCGGTGEIVGTWS